MESELKNCQQCGKVFLATSNTIICPECAILDKEVYQKVREFLIDYPGSKLFSVIEATGVPSKTLLRYLREGRLEITGNIDSLESKAFLTCLNCGIPIRSGEYCKECARTHGNNEKIGYGTYSKKSPAEMRFMFKDKDKK